MNVYARDAYEQNYIFTGIGFEVSGCEHSAGVLWLVRLGVVEWGVERNPNAVSSVMNAPQTPGSKRLSVVQGFPLFTSPELTLRL